MQSVLLEVHGDVSIISTQSSEVEKEMMNYPNCTEAETIKLADILQQNPRKRQCQEELNITELYQIAKPLDLCKVTSCVGALQSLYSVLAKCKYETYSPQYHAKRLLLNCGIKPKAETALDSTAKNVSQISKDTAFAPVGTSSSNSESVKSVPSQATSDGRQQGQYVFLHWGTIILYLIMVW
uniref:AlNc14C89G5632 protein n=1 Tax=Albugo laibachii Nc14 TaxID=890382 RepID=F0WGA2_9STRA|nr:AlNc14C89G5632 [Albugo laibachii Nc14]|eukprot:CCA20237.1 AlNc14C89G5632 [Albugo laibachii Nc14]